MSQKEKEQLQAELSILKELKHPNIVEYYEREHLKDSQYLHLYMEYCGNGDLGQVIMVRTRPEVNCRRRTLCGQWSLPSWFRRCTDATTALTRPTLATTCSAWGAH